MIFPVRVNPIADAEFAEGALWYLRRSEQAAEGFVAAVEDTFARIGANPELFPLAYRMVRRAVVPGFPYAVYFVIRQAECIVIAVHHGKRAPRRWRRRRAG